MTTEGKVTYTLDAKEHLVGTVGSGWPTRHRRQFKPGSRTGAVLISQSVSQSVLQAAFWAPQESGLSVRLLFSEGSQVPKGFVAEGNQSKALNPPSKQKERNVHSPKRRMAQSPKIKAQGGAAEFGSGSVLL